MEYAYPNTTLGEFKQAAENASNEFLKIHDTCMSRAQMCADDAASAENSGCSQAVVDKHLMMRNQHRGMALLALNAAEQARKAADGVEI